MTRIKSFDVSLQTVNEQFSRLCTQWPCKMSYSALSPRLLSKLYSQCSNVSLRAESAQQHLHAMFVSIMFTRSYFIITTYNNGKLIAELFMIPQKTGQEKMYIFKLCSIMTEKIDIFGTQSSSNSCKLSFLIYFTIRQLCKNFYKGNISTNSF